MAATTTLKSPYMTEANSDKHKGRLDAEMPAAPGERGGDGDILNRHLAEDEDDEEDDNGDGLVPRGPPTRPTCPPLQQVAASRLEKKGASTRNQSVPEPTPAIQASDGSPIAGFNDGGVLPRGPQERQEPIQTPRFKRVAAVS